MTESNAKQRQPIHLRSDRIIQYRLIDPVNDTVISDWDDITDMDIKEKAFIVDEYTGDLEGWWQMQIRVCIKDD